MTKLFLVFENQLFNEKYFRPFKSIPFFLKEDFDYLNRFKFHKNRLLFYVRSMREFYRSMKLKGYDLTYKEIEPPENSNKKNYEDQLSQKIKERNIKEVLFFEIEDKNLEKRIKRILKKYNIEAKVIPSPMFLSSRQDFKDYLSTVNSPLMANFYTRQRKKFNILLDDQGKPLGGKWSFDADNRKKIPSNIKFPKDKDYFKEDRHFIKEKKLIENLFPKNPGSMEHYWLPTNHKDAQKVLDDFIKYKLTNFGTYQDSLTTKNDFVFHSLLSPYMNIGLITAEEIINKVLKAHQKDNFPLNSLEGFIRQVIGWREFIRGIYQNYDKEESSTNFWNHKRKLRKCWYDGTTGILPVDDAIKKAQRLGYNHHIERLMVLSNFMLLCEINPKDVYKWFMEMYVDSSEWVMGPNVYGMGQFSDGGIFATKPYISGSNYILKMSDYKKGDWCKVWDGLYWNFINKKKKFYQKNARSAFMVNTLDRMESGKRKSHFEIANQFLKTID